MNDLISRQAAIDIERNATVDTNPMHFEAHQKFTQFMDDAEISSFGRWQWSNGFNTALTAVGIDLKKLPSAQPYTEAEIQKMQDLEQAEIQKAYELGRASAEPEIIRCKDCKHYYEGGWYCSAWNNSPGFPIVTEKGYCNLAERREDEANCWDCKHFEIVRMSAFCHGDKRVTKLRQKDWYSGTIKFCTYFEPKQAERREE